MLAEVCSSDMLLIVNILVMVRIVL